VIAHGVYSWVPEAVREGLLVACRRHLAPQGVAYVSYNVLPGGHVRRMLREMLLMHVEEIEEPDRRCAAARDFLAFLAEAYSGPGSRPDAAALAREAERVAGRSDWSLFHDDLSPIFHLCHFRDFVEACEAHDLRFVAEADYSEMSDAGLPAPAREHLARLAGDLVAREQYLDFVKVRRFRQSLLCRSQVELSDAGTAAVRGMSLATQARRDTSAGDAHDDEWKFRSPGGASFETRSPLFKAAPGAARERVAEGASRSRTCSPPPPPFAGFPRRPKRARFSPKWPFARTPSARYRAARLPAAIRAPAGAAPRERARSHGLQVREGEVVTNLLGASVLPRRPGGAAVAGPARWSNGPDAAAAHARRVGGGPRAPAGRPSGASRCCWRTEFRLRQEGAAPGARWVPERPATGPSTTV
jgi:hypothetical protein